VNVDTVIDIRESTEHLSRLGVYEVGVRSAGVNDSVTNERLRDSTTSIRSPDKVLHTSPSDFMTPALWIISGIGSNTRPNKTTLCDHPGLGEQTSVRCPTNQTAQIRRNRLLLGGDDSVVYPVKLLEVKRSAQPPQRSVAPVVNGRGQSPRYAKADIRRPFRGADR
jgi:hypothetical protein